MADICIYVYACERDRDRVHASDRRIKRRERECVVVYGSRKLPPNRRKSATGKKLIIRK